MQVIKQSCLLLSIWMHILVNAEGPTVLVAKWTKPPPNITVLEGKTIILRCQDYEPVIHKVAWVKGHVVLLAGDERWTLNKRVSLVNLNSSDYSIQIDKVQLTDEGVYTCSFHVNKRQYTTQLYLTVQDMLFRPNITISNINGVSEGQQVFKGSHFSIGCSIQPQYPGGSFELTYTGPNTTHSHTQPAVSHSSTFLFPAADRTHQGNYSCVYHVNVFDRNLSSESQLLSLTVTQ